MIFLLDHLRIRFYPMSCFPFCVTTMTSTSCMVLRYSGKLWSQERRCKGHPSNNYIHVYLQISSNIIYTSKKDRATARGERPSGRPAAAVEMVTCVLEGPKSDLLLRDKSATGSEGGQGDMLPNQNWKQKQ